MERGKRAAGVLAIMLLLQLMAAPAAMAARTLQQQEQEDTGTTPVMGLNTIAKEFGNTEGAMSCGETCAFTPCIITRPLGCTCRNNRLCMR